MKHRLPLIVFFTLVALILVAGILTHGGEQPSSSTATTTSIKETETPDTSSTTLENGFETSDIGTAPTVSTLAPSREVVVTAPDGTPLEGTDVPIFETPSPSDWSPEDPSFTPADDSVFGEPSDLYDVAEQFVREYYTLLPGESAEGWKARITPYTTVQFIGRQTFELLDSEQPHWAFVEEAIEGTGFSDETRARITIWYKQDVSPPDSVDASQEILPALSVRLVLVRFPGLGWRVTSIY